MNVLRNIDEIEQLVDNSNGLFAGKVYVNEEAYLTSVQKLRASWLELGVDEVTGQKVNEVLDKLEEIVTKGKGFMGKRSVSEEEFFTAIMYLRHVLPRIMQESENKGRDGAATTGESGTVRPETGRQIGFDELLRDGKRIFDEIERGESFFVVREGRVVARLTPPL